jgi:plastocyanin
MRHLMRKTIMLSLLLVPAAVLAGCSQKIDEAPEMKAMATPAEKESGPVQEIAIDNFAFSPATVTIAPGTRVVWINHDDVPHTATSTSKPKRFESGTLDTDDKFAHVFTEPGTYNYFCAVHPKMTGQIIVK